MTHDLKHKLAISFCCLPGLVTTVFVSVAMVNNGRAFGLSLGWLRNCSLLAVPLVISGVVLILMNVSKPEQGKATVITQNEADGSPEVLIS